MLQHTSHSKMKISCVTFVPNENLELIGKCNCLKLFCINMLVCS